MDSYPPNNPRKRKRRRVAEQPAIHAQLILDHRLKGDVGLVSEDIFADLFPSHPPRPGIKQRILNHHYGTNNKIQ